MVFSVSAMIVGMLVQGEWHDGRQTWFLCSTDGAVTIFNESPTYNTLQRRFGR